MRFVELIYRDSKISKSSKIYRAYTSQLTTKDQLAKLESDSEM